MRAHVSAPTRSRAPESARPTVRVPHATPNPVIGSGGHAFEHVRVHAQPGHRVRPVWALNGARLPVGRPGDAHEMEAERVARSVPEAADAPALAAATPGPATRPLRDEERRFYEGRLGHDFRGVRLHGDAHTRRSVHTLGARAITVGENIYLGERHGMAGRRHEAHVLAHELTHVAQQRRLGAPRVQALSLEGGGAILGALAGGFLGLASSVPFLGILALAGAGALVGFLGAKVGKAIHGLFADKEPTDEGIPEDDPDFQTVWQTKFQEGLTRLHAGGCQFPQTSQWRYDDKYWEPAPRTPPYQRFVAYKPKSGISPALAVDKLFERLNRWDFDCALYPEVAWIYAFRKTLGAARFNERFKDLVLRQHHSKGVEKDFYDVDTTGQPAFDNLWDNAPVGSKVMWTNRSSAANDTAWKNENAIKVHKGATPEYDRYDAFPLGYNLQENVVKRGLAENASDYPTAGTSADKQTYIDTNIYRHELYILK